MRALRAILACLAILVVPTASDAAISAWYIGEKVVCVNNRFLDLSDAPELVEGDVYTVTDIWPARRSHLGLELEEVDAKASFIAFDERRFIPAFSTARSN